MDHRQQASPVSRVSQFFAELQEIRLSPEFSHAEYLVYLTQIMDELYYMTFFQGTPDDYAFLFAVTPVFVEEGKDFSKDVHDVHFSSLANHAAQYLAAFELAEEPQKLAAIEALEMEVVDYHEIPSFVQPFMQQDDRFPTVAEHFRSFFIAPSD